MFFLLIDIVFNIDYSLFGNLSKVVGTTLPVPPPLSYLREWDGNFERIFSKTYKGYIY